MRMLIDMSYMRAYVLAHGNGMRFKKMNTNISIECFCASS